MFSLSKYCALLLVFLFVFSSCGRRGSHAQITSMAKRDAYPASPKRYSESRSRRIQSFDKDEESNKESKNTKVSRELPRKRIYTASIHLEVREPKQAQKSVLKIMEDSKGFLVSQSLTKMVIRVPAKTFDSVVNSLLKIGHVLDKKIATYDVSARYADIGRRMSIAKKAKQRLLQLLKKVKKIEEKVRIIEEIRRLTQLIEAYKKSLSAIDSYVNFSLIEIYLKIPKQKGAAFNKVSPFQWINSINPERYTLKPLENDAFILKLPPDFIEFDNKDYYLARSPGGSYIRLGKVANNPKGDSSFWQKALENAMQLKNYKLIQSSKTKVLTYSFFQYQSLNPFSYLVAITIQDDEIHVMEAYFPEPKETQKYYEDVIKMLKQLKLKK